MEGVSEHAQIHANQHSWETVYGVRWRRRRNRRKLPCQHPITTAQVHLAIDIAKRDFRIQQGTPDKHRLAKTKATKLCFVVFFYFYISCPPPAKKGKERKEKVSKSTHIAAQSLAVFLKSNKYSGMWQME